MEQVSARWLGVEVVLTVFSESGASQLEGLGDRLEQAGAVLLHQGYCPWEGQWFAALDCIRPDVFVTAKYEAWPDLWSSLATLAIPLVVVSARARSSLRIARRFAWLVGMGLPDLTFSVIDPSQVESLHSLFPTSRVEVTGDPRWDRALHRSQSAIESTGPLIERFGALKQPWAVLGSVWPQDLEQLSSSLKVVAREYGLWVVPHRVTPQSLASIQSKLCELGLHPIRFSEQPTGNSDCVVVDELGFLAELYSRAQWAYVGGGFGKGVHSLIEPAVYGIPLVCGPNRVAESDELIELLRSGQLSVVTSREQVRSWLSTLDKLSLRQEEWRAQALSRRGPSSRIVEILADQIDRKRFGAWDRN